MPAAVIDCKLLLLLTAKLLTVSAIQWLLLLLFTHDVCVASRHRRRRVNLIIIRASKGNKNGNGVGDGN